MLIGFFVDDDGSQYVALQNPTHDASDWPLMMSGSCDFELRFDFSSAPAGVDSSRLLVLDQQLDTVRHELLLPAAGEQVVTVSIDAGDLLFFKYADGAGFAGR